MKIGLISYECPPDTASGGIATYIDQQARVLATAGYSVVVFSASETREGLVSENGYQKVLIKTSSRTDFPALVEPIFSQFHSESPFDVIESPEFSGDGLFIKQRYPGLPLVVRLHTPWHFLHNLNHNPPIPVEPTISHKIRHKIKSLVGMRQSGYSDSYRDFHITMLADLIVSPSTDLWRLVKLHWNIPPSAGRVVPYIFNPAGDLLSIPSGKSKISTIGYTGRLENRKGVQLLIPVINTILNAFPEIKFSFTGRPVESPVPGVNMKDYLLNSVKPEFQHHLLFNVLKPEEMWTAYRDADIMILPSVWENFPNTCLESMSAGRIVLGSRFGGMADMITHGKTGFLINPFNSGDIIRILRQIIERPQLTQSIGTSARKRILSAYSTQSVLPEIIRYYEEAIQRSRQ